jgi:hypothetical protein
MTITTHDKHAAQFIQEYGSTPKRDMAKITAYLKLRAERARRARAVQATPTGPRDERIVLPPGHTSAAVNPCATGPLPIEWKEPESRPVPVFRTVESKPFLPEPVKHKEVVGTLIGTSAIGAKAVNRWAALPCGPAPVEWTSPKSER